MGNEEKGEKKTHKECPLTESSLAGRENVKTRDRDSPKRENKKH